MIPLELSVSYATISSITLQSSITFLEASFTLIYDVSVQASPVMIVNRSSIDDSNMFRVDATDCTISKPNEPVYLSNEFISALPSGTKYCYFFFIMDALSLMLW